MTLEAVGIFLVFLDIRREAQRLAHLLDFCEPLVLIIVKRKYAAVFFRNFGSVRF